MDIDSPALHMNAAQVMLRMRETEREAGVPVGVAGPSAETTTGSAIQLCTIQFQRTYIEELFYANELFPL